MCIQRVLDTPREACLQPIHNQDKSARTPLVVTCHPILPSLCWTTSQHNPSFMFRSYYEGHFCHHLIAFRRLKNMRDLLVRASLTLTPHEEPGNRLCGAARYKTCPILLATDVFSSHTTGELFKVRIRASCKFSSVIYLITCRRCGQLYLSEMGQPLHFRINSHCFDITHTL